ncbi:MAG TPA: response regulator transcription factor [Burkholderiaceae bacterium]|nr:response regulator transcription factor [Burkholderiaceae bacterium]
MSSPRLGDLSVLLVDDHAVVRQGHMRLLEQAGGIRVVGEASDSTEAFRVYFERHPDVAVVDVSLPGVSGIELTRRIVASDPSARVLIFTMHEDPIFATRALEAGAKGYLPKSCMPEEFVDALRTVGRGEFFISQTIAQRLALQQAKIEPGGQLPLSSKEFEVFRLLVSGTSLSEIAAALNLTSKTVANYQSSIRQKLGAENATQLLRIALSRGLLAIDGSTDK